MSSFVIYIPSVYANISESTISKTFHSMKIGNVKHVELIGNATGKSNSAHVYFSEMYDTEISHGIQSTIIDDGKHVKMIYTDNEHVFWILMKSHNNYDGFSNIGEYVKKAKKRNNAKKEKKVVELTTEDELQKLRNEIVQLKKKNDILTKDFNEVVEVSKDTADLVKTFIVLAENNQMPRLRRRLMETTFTKPDISKYSIPTEPEAREKFETQEVVEYKEGDFDELDKEKNDVGLNELEEGEVDPCEYEHTI